MIFSLLAKSRARSKGILQLVNTINRSSQWSNLPNSLKMHGSDLDHMSNLLALQDTVAATSGHTGHVEELGAIDHVVV